MRIITNALTASRKIAPIVTLAVFGLANAAAASIYDDSGLSATAGEAGLRTDVTNPNRIIGGIVGSLSMLVGSIFLVLVIYGGLIWMTAQGNEEKIKKAKNIITSAVIGLVLVFSSYAIANVVIQALTTATSTAPAAEPGP